MSPSEFLAVSAAYLGIETPRPETPTDPSACYAKVYRSAVEREIVAWVDSELRERLAVPCPAPGAAACPGQTGQTQGQSCRL
jgi:hypothetical protein